MVIFLKPEPLLNTVNGLIGQRVTTRPNLRASLAAPAAQASEGEHHVLLTVLYTATALLGPRVAER